MDKHQAADAVEVLDEQRVLTLAELCRSCSVQAQFIEALVEEGILESQGRRGRYWCFSASSLPRTRVTLHLPLDLGINLAGAALALELLDRIAELEARLGALRGGRGP
jgi:chaperone modulatory protein CbpM